MSETPDPDEPAGAAPAGPGLARAFWLRFVGGAVLVFLVLPVLATVVPSSGTRLIAIAAAVAILVWAAVAPISVWRAARTASAPARLAARGVIVGCLALVVWVVVDAIDAYADYVLHAQVESGLLASEPARAAVEAACAAGDPDAVDVPRFDAPHEFVRDVRARRAGGAAVEVEIVYRALSRVGAFGMREVVSEGGTLVLAASCAGGETRWRVGAGTVPEGYRPRLPER